MKFVTKGIVKRYVEAQGNGRRVSTEYMDKLNARVRIMIDRTLEWPANKKTLRDFQ